MPGYYKDCGALGHNGDSEFIMVEIHFNPSTSHWELKPMFRSAHTGANFTDSSNWSFDPSQVEYPSGRSRSYPRVWVARGKHANYATRSACDLGALSYDSCATHSIGGGRILVYEHRNVGSRTYDRLGCQPSGNSLYYQNEREECFYTRRKFEGWQQSPETGVTPYYDFLMGKAFECFAYASLQLNYCYYGAGVIVGP